MEYVKFSAEGGVGTLVIDRPRALNALNDQVIRELDQTLDQIDPEMCSASWRRCPFPPSPLSAALRWGAAVSWP